MPFCQSKDSESVDELLDENSNLDCTQESENWLVFTPFPLIFVKFKAFIHDCDGLNFCFLYFT